MLSPKTFREIVGGRRRGATAAICRLGLRAAAVPYGLAVRLRNFLYDRDWKAVHHVDAAVISVGNLTLGGTGKTPLVEWLARWFRDHDTAVAIVSRGYRSEGGAANDEAKELAARLPTVPHVQDPDRVTAAHEAIARHGCRVVVLDDGFQHRRLARDLDIVLVDATVPWGYGYLFPRGLLREPISSLARAAIVAVSRADLVEPSELAAIERVLSDACPDAILIRLSQCPRCLLDAAGEEIDVAALAGIPLAAFCGIGNAEAFRRTLLACGYDLRAFREFPDHHAYSPSVVRELSTWAAEREAAAVVCTHKDLVKLQVSRLGERPLWALAIALAVDPQEALELKLRSILERCR